MNYNFETGFFILEITWNFKNNFLFRKIEQNLLGHVFTSIFFSFNIFIKQNFEIELNFDLLATQQPMSSLRSRKPKRYGDVKNRYPKIAAAMERLLYF